MLATLFLQKYICDTIKSSSDLSNITDVYINTPITATYPYIYLRHEKTYKEDGFKNFLYIIDTSIIVFDKNNSNASLLSISDTIINLMQNSVGNAVNGSLIIQDVVISNLKTNLKKDLENVWESEINLRITVVEL